MKICICNHDTGADRNLHFNLDDDVFSWSPGHGDWCTGESVRSIRDLSKFMSLQFPAPPKKYVNAFSSMTTGSVSWKSALPREQFKAYLEKMITFSREALEKSDPYMQGAFVQGNDVLVRLESCKVDQDLLGSIISGADPGMKSVLSSFRHEVVPKYDRFASVTGRMSISSGPDILRLKRDYRRILLPESDSRCIKQLDIVSLEPRVCLLVDGQKPPVDIYTHVSKNVFRGDVSRDVVKLATICALYGMSADKLGQKIPKELDPKRILGDVRSYFNIPGLLVKLKNQSKEGFITNHYGRRIEVESNSPLVNYFLQSTGVDVSLLCFREFLTSDFAVRVSPKFIVHDAMFFTCEKDDLPGIESSLEAGIEVPGIGNIAAKIKEIT